MSSMSLLTTLPEVPRIFDPRSSLALPALIPLTLDFEAAEVFEVLCFLGLGLSKLPPSVKDSRRGLFETLAFAALGVAVRISIPFSLVALASWAKLARRLRLFDRAA